MSKISEAQKQIRSRVLPLAELVPAVQMFMNSVEPLLSAEDFQKTKGLAEDFTKKNGVGEKLYGLLEKRKQKISSMKQIDNPTHPDGSNYPNSHWLEGYWEKYAYQSDRSPLATLVNCFESHFAFQPASKPLKRLSFCLLGAIEFRNQLLLDILPPEYAGKMPFCSAQYFRVLSTTRIPHKDCDELKTWPLDSSDHICVNRRGNWYVIHDMCMQSASDLESILEEIKSDADSRGKNKGNGDVAAFTGVNRDSWAANRVNLKKLNSDSLDIIESAVFHVILSEKKPETKDEVMQYGCYGNGEDIWFDKSNTHIMFDNGVFISNLEHSHADAVVPARCWVYMDLFCHKNCPEQGFKSSADFIDTLAKVKPTEFSETDKLSDKIYGNGECIKSMLPKNQNKKSPTKLDFVLDHTLESALVKAKADMKLLIQDHSITVFEFNDFGARSIIRKYGRRNPVHTIGPDSFMQIALHLAYFMDQYSLHKGDVCNIETMLASGYETATTRGFFHGRTETIRPQSIHVRNLCDLWMNQGSTQDMAEEIQKAADYHKEYLKSCMSGNGSDRLLFGLRMVSIEEGLDLHEHPFFMSEAFTKSADFTLSTSQMPFAVQDAPGFGAYSPNAYAVCYRFTHKNAIIANISTRQNNGKDVFRFKKHLQEALKLIDSILSSSSKL